MIKYEGSVFNQIPEKTNGIAFANATVTIRKQRTGAKADLYIDDFVTPAENPLTASLTGDYEFYAAPGQYRFIFNEGTSYEKEMSNVLIGGSGDSVSTVDEMIKSCLPVGYKISCNELSGAEFDVLEIGASQKDGDRVTDEGLILALKPMPNNQWNVLHFGAIPDNTSVSYQEQIQKAVNRGIAYIPRGIYRIESIQIPYGNGIVGEHRTETRLEKVPDTDGHAIYSPAPTQNNRPYIRLENFTVFGNRGLYTEPYVCDGIHIAGDALYPSEAVVAKNVYCRAMTGNGWYIGPERNVAELYDCYGYDVDVDGLQVNSSSDLIVIHGGFGSAGSNSVQISTSATPVLIGCEIWWADGNASVNLYQNTTFMLKGCNLDRGRNGVVRVVGRQGVDNRHENGFIEGCTFLGPRGAGGAGVDGDLNFIDLINTRGINICGNSFESYPAGGTDVLVNYIVSTSGTVENVNWVGNHYGEFGIDAPYVNGVWDNPTPFTSHFSNLYARRAFFGAPDNSAVEMARSTFGEVTRYLLGATEYGAMSVRSDGIRLNGNSGVAINLFGPYADDSAAGAAGINVGEAYYLPSGDVKVRIS